MKPVRTPSEELSTQAKVQIVGFLHDWYNISPLCHYRNEWSYVAWRRCRNDEEELTKYLKTEGYRLTFEECKNAEAAMALQAGDSGPLEFEDKAPLGLIQRACKAYLSGAESFDNIRDIVCNFRSSTTLLDDVQPANVCSEIYVTLFPCPRCSTPDTLLQVFHHQGVNGRKLRYELSFASFDDRQDKSTLVKLTISTTISHCMVSKALGVSHRPLVPSFTVYARDVFAYLDRNDLDRSELVSFAWRQTLVNTRASMAVRCLCMELVMALIGTWVTPIIYNPGLDELEVDRRQFKLPYRSAEHDSQLIRDHLRNSFLASMVVAHEWGDDIPVSGNAASRWVCGMVGGLDNCRIGELSFSQVYPTFEDIAMILDRAMSRNRPQKLSMTFTSDEQLRQFITLEGFLLDGRFRDIKRMELSAIVSHGSVVPTWSQFLFLPPFVQKFRIRYEIYEPADVSELRYVLDNIVQDFLVLEHMAARDDFDFYLSINRPVPFLSGDHVSTSSSAQVTDASWCPIEEYACDGFRFNNVHCHKELVVYTCVTEHESVALCRLR